MNEITLFSMNCQGLANYRNRKDVLNYIRAHEYKIVCLQDIHITKNTANLMLNEWGYGGVIAPYSSSARGVAILFNNRLEYKILKSTTDQNGNYIILDLKIEDDNFTLVNLYGPNTDSPEFYKKVFSQIDFDRPVIICGDWNLTLNWTIDTENYKRNNNPHATNIVLETISDNDLCDPWRIQHPREKGFTWRKKNPRKQARLDFFLVTEDVMTYITESKIIPGYKTDHSAVCLTLSMTNETRGRGYWKFNNSLLRDNMFVQKTKEIISDVMKQYAASPYDRNELMSVPKEKIHYQISDQLLLEVLLMEIRQQTMKYGAKKKKERTEKEKELENKIRQIEELLNSNISEATELFIELEKYKSELQKHREKVLEGVITRSRTRWYGEGEKPTRYFCNLEKRNYINKTIKEIDVEGRRIRSQAEIIDEQKKFYEKMYANKNTDCLLADEVLKSLNIKKLTSEQAELLEGPITYKELCDVVKEMKNNKSPGLDGYTVEFYKFFWSDLGQIILRALNEAYLNGELSVTHRRGVITCIPKPDKDRRFLSNWRPITLLTTIYKMASGCISHRIKKVLGTVISDEQTGFIKGRFLADNLRFLYDILYETKNQNIPGLLIAIDFEKAFDSVSTTFIHKAMACFGFGESIQKWVKIFYKNMSGCIIQNGHLSTSFPLRCGCRQGDPIAPYIFLICIQVLISMIKENKDIKGITINDSEHKLSFYADDGLVLLDGQEKSLRSLLDTLNTFYKISGLAININKTKAIWIGKSRTNMEQICEDVRLVWTQEEFTVLGVKFNTELTNLTEINLDSKLKKIQSLFTQWKRRRLTLLGKVTMIKTMAISLIVHLFIALPNPSKDYVKKIEKIVYKFLWNNGPDKIKRSVIIQNCPDGGLKMIDIQSFLYYLKLKWIRRAVTGEYKWNTLSIGRLNTSNILKYGANYVNQAKITQNPFWTDVFEAWRKFIELGSANPLSADDLLSEPLWFNTNFKNKKMFLMNWAKEGIIFLRDILDENGNFLSYESLTKIYKLKGTFLHYEQLKHSIPKEWLLAVSKGKNRTCLAPIPKYLKLILSPSKKLIYASFIKIKNSEKPSSIKKWERSFIDEMNWRHAFQATRLATQSTYLQSLQYKIMHNITCTNITLVKMKIIQEDKCSFCKNDRETISHMFTECPYATKFWSDVKKWYENETTCKIQFHQQTILFGFHPKHQLENLITIAAKAHIYSSRIQNQIPHIDLFLMKLWNIYNTERYIARTNDKYRTFKAKWAKLASFMNSTQFH